MKSVHELSAEELQELRSNYFHRHLTDDEIEENDWSYESEEEIPMDIVIAYYEGTYFVEEDFFCNITDDEQSLIEKLKLTENEVNRIVLEWYTNGMCADVFQNEEGEDLEEYLEPIVYP
jgi:hypothetical protein